MKKNHVWLTSSFFYDILKWCLLLREIEVFLTEVICDEFIYFQVAFSYEPIKHVKFAILCEDEIMMDTIGAKFYKCFTQFKEKHRPQEYRVEVNGIGLPYPTDTFQIGLFQLPIEKNRLEKYRAEEMLSKLMFSGLKTGTFSEEDIHTLAIYVIVIFGKVVFDYNQQVAKDVFINLQNDYFLHGQSIKNVFPEEYDEITNLSKQLLSVADIEKEELWLAPWYEFCKTYIDAHLNNILEPIQIENKIEELYINKVNLITNQLGIQNESKAILSSLVNYSLVFNI